VGVPTANPTEGGGEKEKKGAGWVMTEPEARHQRCRVSGMPTISQRSGFPFHVSAGETTRRSGEKGKEATHLIEAGIENGSYVDGQGRKLQKDPLLRCGYRFGEEYPGKEGPPRSHDGVYRRKGFGRETWGKIVAVTITCN